MTAEVLPRGGPESKFIPIRTREDLGKIVAVNPGTGIVSVTKYNQYFGTADQRKRGETEFKPWRMGTPEFADVEVAKGDVRRLLLDGHHRTIGVYDNFKIIQEKFPYFFAEPDPTENPPLARFRFYDATEDTLNNPAIVDKDSKGDRKVLTMDEYLIAVIVPTLEQEEIAPRRIAAKLMLGWSSMVGEELAAKFSGLAALSFLQDQKMQYRDKRTLQAKVGEIKTFFKENTEEEKREIRSSLVSLGMVIKRAETQSAQSGRQIRKEDIAAAAFELIGESSGALGTSEDIQQQVNGLLYHPEIQHKLVQRYGPGDPLIGGIQELGGQVATAIKKYSRGKNDELGHIQRSLVDPRFTLDDAVRVITAKEPSQEYDKVDLLVQRRIVTQAYLRYRTEQEKKPEPVKFEDLTEFEIEALRDAPFVKRAGKPGGSSIETSVQHIGIIATGLQQASEFKSYLVSIHTSILTPGEKTQIQREIDFQCTKIKIESKYGSESAAARIDAIDRETHEKVDAARRRQQTAAPQEPRDDKREDRPTPRPEYHPEPASEVDLLVGRTQRDGVYYRNHRLDFAIVPDEAFQGVVDLYVALEAIIADHEAKKEQ